MKCIETAFNWHGGISSALYSFASTRKIHSENHRDDVLDEIDECLSCIDYMGSKSMEISVICNP